MKAFEKKLQRLNYSNSIETNSKYNNGKRWRINTKNVIDLLDFIEEQEEVLEE